MLGARKWTQLPQPPYPLLAQPTAPTETRHASSPSANPPATSAHAGQQSQKPPPERQPRRKPKPPQLPKSKPGTVAVTPGLPLWSGDSFQRFAQYVKRNRSRIRAAVAPVQKLLAAAEYLPTAARQKMSVHLTALQATLDTIPTAAPATRERMQRRTRYDLYLDAQR